MFLDLEPNKFKHQFMHPECTDWRTKYEVEEEGVTLVKVGVCRRRCYEAERLSGEGGG